VEQIERFGESLERELFHFAGGYLRRNIAKMYHWLTALPDQLDRSVFSREERNPQRFLAIDDLLQRGQRIFL
jgi:hypothetical protein